MPDGPFRGSAAVARGALTRAQLRSRRFRQLFRDVYEETTPEPPDLVRRSRAAALLLPAGEGALAGYSAAALLGADCAPRDAPAELIAPGSGVRARPGLVVHRGVLPEPDVCVALGCRVTTPVRTAWDLARRLGRTEAVVAVDALARVGRFDPAVLLASRPHRPAARGCRRLDTVVALADARAESPMETRLRLLLVDHGLPVPAVQYPIVDGDGHPIARVDLAYPAVTLAIEYDGEDFHRGRRRQDNRRDIALAQLGWETMRFGPEDVYVTPLQTADQVRRMREARSSR